MAKSLSMTPRPGESPDEFAERVAQQAEQHFNGGTPAPETSAEQPEQPEQPEESEETVPAE